MTCPASGLTDMRTCAESTMFDTCTIVEVIDSDDVDEYGHAIIGKTETSSSCGLDIRGSKEWLNAEARVFDARIRLPLTVEISNIDHIIVTHRYGEAIDNLRYELIGDARPGMTAYVADLRSSPNG